MLSFNAPLHISQQESVSLLLKCFFFLKYTLFMTFLFDNFIITSLILSIAFRVEIFLFERDPFWQNIAILSMMFWMLIFFLKENRGTTWMIFTYNINFLLLTTLFIFSLSIVLIFFLKHCHNIFLFWLFLLFLRFLNMTCFRLIQCALFFKFKLMNLYGAREKFIYFGLHERHLEYFSYWWSLIWIFSKHFGKELLQIRAIDLRQRRICSFKNLLN